MMDRSEFEHIKKSLLKEGMVPLKIVSDSMEPLLKVGRNYKVASLGSTPKRFDIVVFYRGAKLMAHYVWRVNSLKGLSFTTRSLKAPAADEVPVEEKDLLGILVGKRINFIRKLLLNIKYD